ncbi:germination protein YpeB [Clostridium cochlearium]|uniref:Germination protein YpeB n=1 Tax=Clostridium cochlearium TaxID=1494 RepID=A0A239YZC5_CLOCO|nr:germination protein YpeB [Clostridium cochlearium]MBV1818787.1 germination protein YpeB [Bacteroidales bacterium MSK.15.36]MBU5270079.1 germination protein YpeB [Clostridium cochlearium]MCG4572106.1 germination protein YpeB [Clostridium cochlearium]MCR1972178.1 germination protein YpeB [Clostridium cochlearium]SDL19263.1 germination protein YpeB [Clostridium cochlearium]
MKKSSKRIIYTAIVTIIVVFSSTFAILMTLERTDYRNYLQAQYSKNMYELMDSVQNIRVNLSKAAVVGSREQKIIVFDEIFRHATNANDRLHSLPLSQDTIENTSKFLSQVGDFCYTLGKTTSEGTELQDKDYKNIEGLKNRSFKLEANLNQVSDEINEGRVKWGEIRKKVGGVLARNKEDVSEKFKGIQKQVTQYPSLIYDGPFSDNVVEIEPRINKEREISKEDAEKKIKTVIGEDKVTKISLINRESNTGISTYSFEVALKGRNNKNDKIVCEVSKKGGKILYLLDNRLVENGKIEIDTAIKKGKEFLKSIGYKEMVPTYTTNYGNVATISYVYKKDDIMVYPDQIKLKIALDDGSIVGIESEKYLVSHTEDRNIPNPKVSLEEARGKVGKRLKVKASRLAIIPTETNKEKLCYEFTGDYNGETFIVYINSDNGYEERIIQIINTPNGQLTI